ncbi:hypothetical protein GE115_10980 [Agromyces sp. CFH 90414]|uniref:Uncharacterized protein n=1 Tax=Agromyces agglutinans TaxID=2662258 RepID=A0A6I2FER1_9MICO|nr:hypothetical protein [Agromyces agglutinans]MRG60383.1 hypothetical protein [Agromyces agglutinans]
MVSNETGAGVTETQADRPPMRRPQRPLAAVAGTLLILGFGFAIFGFSPALFATMYAGMIAPYVAIPYTLVAIIAREVSARRGTHDVGTEPPYREDAMGFTMFRQRASLVNAVAMLGALIVAFALSLFAGGDASGSPIDGGLMTIGAFAVVAGAFAIVVNVPSIYTRAVVRAERHAIRHRTGAWKLILANTILTTGSWIAYCGFGIHFLIEVGGI